MYAVYVTSPSLTCNSVLTAWVSMKLKVLASITMAWTGKEFSAELLSLLSLSHKGNSTSWNKNKNDKLTNQCLLQNTGQIFSGICTSKFALGKKLIIMLTFTFGKMLCLLRKFESVSTHTLDKTRDVSVISHLSANHVPSLSASIICCIQNSHISQQFLLWCVISFTAEIISLHISRKNMHCNLLRKLTRKRCEFIIFYCTLHHVSFSHPSKWI